MRYSPFGIDLVLGLLALSKHANSVVCSATTAHTRTITFGLFQTTAIASLANSFPHGTIEW